MKGFAGHLLAIPEGFCSGIQQHDSCWDYVHAAAHIAASAIDSNWSRVVSKPNALFAAKAAMIIIVSPSIDKYFVVCYSDSILGYYAISRCYRMVIC